MVSGAVEQIIADYCERYPDYSANKLAKLIVKQRPDLDKSARTLRRHIAIHRQGGAPAAAKELSAKDLEYNKKYAYLADKDQ